MSLRRGFKSEAERIAVEIRREMSLTPTSRLAPRLLAEHLEIPVFTIKDCVAFAENHAVLRRLQGSRHSEFSAITIFIGTRRIIIHNETHAETRQANDIVHEVSHCLLEHPPVPIADQTGCRRWNAEMEDEAAWLAGALLVPRAGALSLALAGATHPEIAKHYGVSLSLCRWRINQTGIAHQLDARSKWLRSTA